VRALLLVLLAGCVSPLSLEGHPCPCDEGHVCCMTTSGPRCLRQEDVKKLSCQAPVSPDAAADAAADAGPPDARPADAAPADATPADLMPPAARCQNGGGGLRASYYAGDSFQGTPYRRSESVLVFDSFNFLEGHLPKQSITAVFSGDLVPESTDTYSFHLFTDGAARLWIGGELVFDTWIRSCCNNGLSARIALEGGKRTDFRLELLSNNPAGSLALFWRSYHNSGWSAIPPCALIEKEPGPVSCPTAFGDCAPPGTPSCTVQPGNGVRASYFTAANYSGDGPVQTWDSISPGPQAPPVPAGAHSARWEFDLVAPTTERYTLYMTGRGGTRIENDAHQTVIAVMGDTEEVEAPIDLVQGQRRRLVMYEPLDNVGAWPRLRWKSAQVPRSTIPKCRFFLPATP
jgi:hypothetical protein